MKQLLEEAGAKVFITRTEDVPIELWPRVDAAERAGADLLVSIHNNALPDGVNPFTNSGTSVYYNHPRSVPLARAVQAELVRRLGVRDLGIGRGDLALVRTTWMPSILTEGLFMMRPRAGGGAPLAPGAAALRRGGGGRDPPVLAGTRVRGRSLPSVVRLAPGASPVANPTSRRASG